MKMVFTVRWLRYSRGFLIHEQALYKMLVGRRERVRTDPAKGVGAGYKPDRNHSLRPDKMSLY